MGVLVQLNLRLDGVKGVALPNTLLYLVGEAYLPPRVQKKRATVRVNAPGTQVRDFIPWVRPESSQLPDSEEGEEEEMTGLLDRYTAKKRKRQENVERRSDAAPDQTDGSSQPDNGGSSKVQAIIIPGSTETGSNDRLDVGADQTDGSSRPDNDGSSKVQAIIIPGSTETGSNNRLDVGDNALGELREAD